MASLLENNAGGSRLKTFILENRDLYRLLLARFLGEKNGHEHAIRTDKDENLPEASGPRFVLNQSSKVSSGSFYGSLTTCQYLTYCRKGKPSVDLRPHFPKTALQVPNLKTSCTS